MPPEIEKLKHIGDWVDGKLVCRPDCPSSAHTPTKSNWETHTVRIKDTEIQCDTEVAEWLKADRATLLASERQALVEKMKRAKAELREDDFDWPYKQRALDTCIALVESNERV